MMVGGVFDDCMSLGIRGSLQIMQEAYVQRYVYTYMRTDWMLAWSFSFFCFVFCCFFRRLKHTHATTHTYAYVRTHAHNTDVSDVHKYMSQIAHAHLHVPYMHAHACGCSWSLNLTNHFPHEMAKRGFAQVPEGSQVRFVGSETERGEGRL